MEPEYLRVFLRSQRPYPESPRDSPSFYEGYPEIKNTRSAHCSHNISRHNYDNHGSTVKKPGKVDIT